MDNLTSPSFPRGIECNRTEQDVRAARENARLSMADVIVLGARRPQHKGCPFCGSDPKPAAKVCNRWVVACEAEDCRVSVEAAGATPEEAFAIWDARI